MNYWLVKSEPDTYSWSTFVKDKRTFWDGVRNYQARNNIREMKNGDLVLFYHSGDERSVIGTASVVKEPYQDPTTDDAAWLCVDLKAGKALKEPVTLKSIKADPNMQNIGLIKQGRLSVIKLTKTEYESIAN
ncbi:MAG: EVE domain-containing protein [Ignavibacteria bacterium]|nr:EVE domain-containing protein [Ignavibacteria bacterium]